MLLSRAIITAGAMMLMSMPCFCQTIRASSCEEEDVQSALDSAVDGDLVVVPDGSCFWATPVHVGTGTHASPIGKAVTLKGSPNTIIYVGQSTPSEIDPEAIEIYTEGDKPVRVTGFTFVQASTAVAFTGASQGQIEVRGNGTKCRIDNNKFYNSMGYIVNFFADCVFDHNIDYPPNVSGVDKRYYFRNGDLSTFTTPLQLGTTDGAYIEDNIHYSCVLVNGACTTGYGQATISDGEFSGRAVFRNNTFYNLGSLVFHGTEGVGNRGMKKWEAYRNNFIKIQSSNDRAFHFRSGNGVVFGNRITNQQASGYAFGGTVTTYRDNQSAGVPFNADCSVSDVGFGKCAGWGKFDLNYSTNSVWYSSGTHTGANRTSVLVDNTTTWTDGMWQRHGVVNLTQASTWYGLSGWIYQNTSTRIFTLRDHSGGNTCLPRSISGTLDTNGTAVTRVTGQSFLNIAKATTIRIAGTNYTVSSITDADNLVIAASAGVQSGVAWSVTGSDSQVCWDTGDTYVIGRASACIDQAGWAPSTNSVLLSFSGGCMTPPGWVNLELMPVYGWGNLINGTTMPILDDTTNSDGESGSPTQTVSNAVPEVHFYNQNNSSNTYCTSTSTASPQTCGVRVGLFSDLPAQCTKNVAYWATDVGEWDSTNGKTPDGQLYKCVETDTWQLYYKPYPYPHPITAETKARGNSRVRGSVGFR